HRLDYNGAHFAVGGLVPDLIGIGALILHNGGCTGNVDLLTVSTDAEHLAVIRHAQDLGVTRVAQSNAAVLHLVGAGGVCQISGCAVRAAVIHISGVGEVIHILGILGSICVHGVLLNLSLRIDLGNFAVHNGVIGVIITQIAVVGN